MIVKWVNRKVLTSVQWHTLDAYCFTFEEEQLSDGRKSTFSDFEEPAP